MFFLSGILGSLVAVLTGLVLYSLQGTSRQQLHEPASLPGSRNALDGDITSFGDELRRLELDAVGNHLTEEARSDYAAALDAYDDAKRALRDAHPMAVAPILAQGRHRAASVRARIRGDEVPPPPGLPGARHPATTDFGPTSRVPATSGTRRIRGVTALDEMAVLDDAGQRGWRLVGFGPLYLDVASSSQQWRHARTALERPHRRRSMLDDGWQLVGTWGFWTYYTRPTGVPAVR